MGKRQVAPLEDIEGGWLDCAYSRISGLAAQLPGCCPLAEPERLLDWLHAIVACGVGTQQRARPPSPVLISVSAPILVMGFVCSLGAESGLWTDEKNEERNVSAIRVARRDLDARFGWARSRQVARRRHGLSASLACDLLSSRAACALGTRRAAAAVLHLWRRLQPAAPEASLPLLRQHLLRRVLFGARAAPGLGHPVGGARVRRLPQI